MGKGRAAAMRSRSGRAGSRADRAGSGRRRAAVRTTVVLDATPPVNTGITDRAVCIVRRWTDEHRASVTTKGTARWGILAPLPGVRNKCHHITCPAAHKRAARQWRPLWRTTAHYSLYVFLRQPSTKAFPPISAESGRFKLKGKTGAQTASVFPFSYSHTACCTAAWRFVFYWLME